MQPLTSATSSGVTLSLNMLNLIVSVHGAVGEDDSQAMKMVCSHDHAPTPLKQKMSCPACGNNDYSTFGRAKQVGDGYVVIPADVIEKAKDSASAYKKQITITVHPAAEVSSVLMPSGKSYYLSMKNPNQASLDTYTLMGQLISMHPDKAFMAKFALRTATSLFQLVVAGEGTLVLRQMADAELVREHPSVLLSTLDPRTLELAGMLAEQQLTPFLVAEHGTGKSSIIGDYAATQTPLAPVEGTEVKPVGGGNILDLSAALEAMLAPAVPVKAIRKPRAKKVAPVAVAS